MKVIDGTKQNAPDDIHMSRRYAVLLEILLNKALQASQPVTPRSNRTDFNSHASLHPVEVPQFNIHELNLGEEWMYDPNFWETLPDMVGLNIMPSLISS